MGLRNFGLDAAVDDWMEYYLGDGPSLIVFLILNATTFLIRMGFYAHSDPTLLDLPTFLYPLFDDSPAALVLMTPSTATLLPNLGHRVADAPVNRSLAHLHTLAFVWLVKYSVWTVVALSLRPGLYVSFSGTALWDYWGIVLTHADFLAFTLIVPRYGTTMRGALGFTLTLALVNDVFDYGLNYYPPLEYEAGTLLADITVTLSFLAVFLTSWAFNRLPDATETTHERPASHSR